MPRSDRPARRRPGGIAAVGVLGALALVVAAGLVLWGRPAPSHPAVTGVLADYRDRPAVAWSLDDSRLPGYAGTGGVRVADHRGGDWLLSYPSNLGGSSAQGRSFLLVDAATGAPHWRAPVRAGLGDCALTAAHRVGCAVKLGDRPDGFYLIGDDGSPEPAGPLDDTVRVTAVGDDFLRIDQSGRHAVLRSATGVRRWSRDFPAAATARLTGTDLIVESVDGHGFVLDPATGADLLACAECTVLDYPGGLLTLGADSGGAAVSVYPRHAGVPAAAPVRVATGMTVVNGPSVLPVLTGTGPEQVLADAGRYEVVDPATGAGLWQIADPELSKSHTRPCGSVVALASKDRSRRFFTLADGTPLGSLPPPAIDDPDHNLDLLRCVGSSAGTVLFASPDVLTAFDLHSGAVAWDLDINGTVADVDGTVVLSEGSSLRVLRPN